MFGIGALFFRPGHWLMLFSKIWFATVERTAWQFLPLGMAAEKNMGRKFFRIFTRSPDSCTSRKYGLSCGKLHMFSVILDAIGVLILEALSAAATLQTPCQAALIAAYVHHSPSLFPSWETFQVQEKQISSNLKNTCSRWWFHIFLLFSPLP